jgi:hypothetical protein
MMAYVILCAAQMDSGPRNATFYNLAPTGTDLRVLYRTHHYLVEVSFSITNTVQLNLYSLTHI